MLRDVDDADLDAIYEQQRDPESVAMALVPSRERDAFEAHWRRIRADETTAIRVIEADGEVAGHVLSWEQDGRRLVGYWLGREFWGRGLATAALAEFVAELPRPLHARVARSNPASRRVLEKCGFVPIEERAEHDERIGRVVDELRYELR